MQDTQLMRRTSRRRRKTNLRIAGTLADDRANGDKVRDTQLMRGVSRLRPKHKPKDRRRTVPTTLQTANTYNTRKLCGESRVAG